MDPSDWFANHVLSIALLCLLVLYVRARSLGGTVGFFLGAVAVLLAPTLFFIAASREPRTELFPALVVAACLWGVSRLEAAAKMPVTPKSCRKRLFGA